jgi:archaellin
MAAGADRAPGELVIDNAGPSAVAVAVRLVAPSGAMAQLSTSVAPGTDQVLPEQLGPGTSPSSWVGALVTVYGGRASVNQEVSTDEGTASQPCASTAASQWYFPAGATLRNADDEISLLNPYPVNVVVDMSFSTDQGLEQPAAFRGVVVPAQGLTVLDLGNHLRRRTHVAVTVTTRSGAIVAFQTELVTKPAKGAPRVGVPGALDPVEPVAGVTLMLGATQASASLWWPQGGEGFGLTEQYDVYNPGPSTAQVRLSLVAPGSGAGLGSSTNITVGAYGTDWLTTNGQPWALPGLGYAVHLQSTNGVPVVAARLLTAESPWPYRGTGALLGSSLAARQWLVPPNAQLLAPSESLAVADPGRTPAVVSTDTVDGAALVPVPGVPQLVVAAGRSSAERLPLAPADQAVVLVSTVPVIVERDAYAYLPLRGVDLSPAVVLGAPG